MYLNENSLPRWDAMAPVRLLDRSTRRGSGRLPVSICQRRAVARFKYYILNGFWVLTTVVENIWYSKHRDFLGTNGPKAECHLGPTAMHSFWDFICKPGSTSLGCQKTLWDCMLQDLAYTWVAVVMGWCHCFPLSSFDTLLDHML